NASPNITFLSPGSGPVGTAVTITGSNFGTSQGSSSASFNGTVATPTSWSSTSIVAPVPSGATSGNVVVTVSGQTSNAVSYTVTADTIPPSVPTALTAGSTSSTQINLSWTASTDNVAVSGYNIFRGGSQVGTSPTASYSDTGLVPSTTYTYTVTAFDAAGNTSAQSASSSATTQASSSGGTSYPMGWTMLSNTSIQ